MAYKNLQMRRDTAANWTSNDPTLLSGEMGYETDTYKIKIGDGSTAWISLSYFDSGGFQAPQTVDDESSQLTNDTVYRAATDGFVTAWAILTANGFTLTGKVGASNPPTITVIKNMHQHDAGIGTAIGFAVPKNYYWEVELVNGSLTDIIWTPMGSGSVAPITP